MAKLNRSGIKRLIASGHWSGVTLSRKLNISRNWLLTLMKGREMKHPALTAWMNETISELLDALKKKA